MHGETEIYYHYSVTANDVYKNTQVQLYIKFYAYVRSRYFAF